MNPERTYSVKKIFGPTIQGEGSMSGTVCHFVRFSGCNMWDGRPETRSASACPYCDTDFYKGTKMTADQIIAALKELPEASWVVLSGGEPMLQVDRDLLERLHAARFRVAIETNGTVNIETFMRFDHITCSPKVPRDQMKLRSCHDMKVLFPHPDPKIKPEDFDDFNARNFFLQPIDGAHLNANTDKALKAVIKSKGKWRLSLQIHKMLGVE